jgi:hypothetical protein
MASVCTILAISLGASVCWHGRGRTVVLQTEAHVFSNYYSFFLKSIIR